MKPKKIHFEFNESITENLTNLLQSFYLSVKVKKYTDSDDYDYKLSRRFKLDRQYSHKIIDSCRILLEDTELAINDYEKYGLQGPTRLSSNIGERYIRLYGLLNAVNLQKSVVVQLYEIFKIDGKRQLIQAFKQSPIIQTRNKAGSHTVDYFEEGMQDHFILAQMTVEGKGERILIVGHQSSSEEINLEFELHHFKKLFHKCMLNLLRQATTKVLDNKSVAYKDFQNYFSLIEEQILGNKVSKKADGDFYIIRFETR